jgi:hypothetical protein
MCYERNYRQGIGAMRPLPLVIGFALHVTGLTHLHTTVNEETRKIVIEAGGGRFASKSGIVRLVVMWEEIVE